MYKVLSMERKAVGIGFFIALTILLSTFYFLLASAPALAIDADRAYKLSQETGNERLGLRPNCDPTKAPSEPGACNISAFALWVQKLIKWMFWISLPLALIFGIYGGFVIITAGGAEERFKRGKSILTAAIVGLAIIFTANLIVGGIVKLLSVQSPYSEQILGK